MVGPKYMRKASGFQMRNVLAAGQFWDEEKDANAATIGGGHSGKLTQRNEGRTLDSDQSHVGDYQRPFTGFQFGQEHLGVRDNADTPSLGIQDLFDRSSAGIVVVKDKDANLQRDRSGTSTHNT